MLALHVGHRRVPFDGRVVYDAWTWVCCCVDDGAYDALIVDGTDPLVRNVFPRLTPAAELWVMREARARPGGVLHALAHGVPGVRAVFASYVFVDADGVCTRVHAWEDFVAVVRRAEDGGGTLRTRARACENG